MTDWNRLKFEGQLRENLMLSCIRYIMECGEESAKQEAVGKDV